VEETSIGEGVQVFQNMKAFLHYRQDCLFKPPPIFPVGNPLYSIKPSCLRKSNPSDFLYPIHNLAINYTPEVDTRHCELLASRG